MLRFCTSSLCIPFRLVAAICAMCKACTCHLRGEWWWFQGTSYRVGTRGSGVHGSWFGDQQASVLCGSWWCLILVNRTHSGFRSVPWGCEALSSPLLCFQMVHPCWSSQRSGGGGETEAGAWQTHKAGEARSSLRTYFLLWEKLRAEGASQGELPPGAGEAAA